MEKLFRQSISLKDEDVIAISSTKLQFMNGSQDAGQRSM